MKMDRVLLTVMLSLGISNAQDRLSLELVFEKDEFLVGELIHCGVNLENNGVSPITIITPFYHAQGLNFILTEMGGKELKYTGRLVNGMSQDKMSLSPGGNTFHVFELTYMFGNQISLASLHKLLKNGEYVLSVLYESGLGDKLLSEVRFKVVEPKANELKAYQLFV